MFRFDFEEYNKNTTTTFCACDTTCLSITSRYDFEKRKRSTTKAFWDSVSETTNLPITARSVGSHTLAERQGKVILPRPQPTYPARAVELEEPVKQITKMLELERLKEGAEVMVIYGFGGIGKTTLANAVVANLNPKAKGSNYAEINIAEDPPKNKLKNIQEQLLQDAFPKYEGGREINLRDCKDGRHHLTQAFQCEANKPVFIFMDNVLRTEDLQELLPEDLQGLSQNSRILVTARDLSVTDLFEERGLSRRIYPVQPLVDEHGKKILCKDPQKLEQIKNDVNKILKICCGIPLALKIVGAQWKKHEYRVDNCSVILQALEKGEEIKQENLSERLFKFVYNRLETSVQEAFLDIRSVLDINYFNRRDIEYIVGVNEAAILEEAALITAVPYTSDDIKYSIQLEGEEN